MTYSNPSRILLADDHPMVLNGLSSFINKEQDLEVVGKADDGQKLLDILRTKDVDLVITDISMPNLDGVESAKKIRKLYPNVRILVLSMFEDPVYIKNMLEAGTNGYLTKNSESQEILKAIRLILKGESYYSQKVTNVVMESVKNPSASAPILSKREKEIVCLICEEFTTREIGEKLFISFHTAEKHRKNIITKLGVRNTAGLVGWALRNGVCK